MLNSGEVVSLSWRPPPIDTATEGPNNTAL